jgi:hypothetical protein
MVKRELVQSTAGVDFQVIHDWLWSAIGSDHCMGMIGADMSS